MLAVLFAAAHRAIEARLKNRTIAAMLSVLIVVVPFGIGAVAVTQGALAGPMFW